MKVNVPGRGAVDIGHVVVLGPVWTDIDMYRETCHLLQRTADAAAGDAIPIEFSWQPWHADEGDGHMLRQMVRLLAAEWSDGRPYVDGVCMLLASIYFSPFSPTYFRQSRQRGCAGFANADAPLSASRLPPPSRPHRRWIRPSGGTTVPLS